MGFAGEAQTIFVGDFTSCLRHTGTASAPPAAEEMGERPGPFATGSGFAVPFFPLSPPVQRLEFAAGPHKTGQILWGYGWSGAGVRGFRLHDRLLDDRQPVMSGCVSPLVCLPPVWFVGRDLVIGLAIPRSRKSARPLIVALPEPGVRFYPNFVPSFGTCATACAPNSRLGGWAFHGRVAGAAVHPYFGSSIRRSPIRH